MMVPIPIPITTARKVVPTMNIESFFPNVGSRLLSPLFPSPRIIESPTSGIITIFISRRKSCPGRAIHSMSILICSAVKLCSSVRKNAPSATPATIPIKT